MAEKVVISARTSKVKQLSHEGHLPVLVWHRTKLRHYKAVAKDRNISRNKACYSPSSKPSRILVSNRNETIIKLLAKDLVAQSFLEKWSVTHS
jgi:hypothetical protein